MTKTLLINLKRVLFLTIIGLILFLPLLYAQLSILLVEPSIDTDSSSSDEMYVKITSPSGYETGWLPLNYWYTSGSATYYNLDYGYSFCPEEGTYSATFWYTPTNVYGTNNSFYTVNYDAEQEWCQCYQDYFGIPTAWAIGGEVAATSCCGDDPNEFIKSCQPSDQVPCTVSTDNLACCDSSSDCVYNGNCYSDGAIITVNGVNYQCSNGQWILACKTNGQSCSSDSECCSNHCSSDFDRSGSWCCDINQCAHNGVCYNEGTSFTYNGSTYTCRNGEWTNCYPPSTRDWIITENCYITQNIVVNGDLIIKSSGVLTIDNATVTIYGNLIREGVLHLINGGKIVIA